MIKFKTQNKFKIPILKDKLGRYLFLFCIYFEFCALFFGFFSNAYALNLAKAKAYFLSGDYKSAILEGEKILANGQDASDLAELYYLLGLSYLKDGNYLRASDIFEIILKEYKNNALTDEAKLGLADSYLLREEYTRAEQYYQDIIIVNPDTKLKAQIYHRLSQIGFKKGDNQQARQYLDKLKEELPLSLESRLSQDLYPVSEPSSNFYYTVQVGSFSKKINAANLTEKLTGNNYSAYMEEISVDGKVTYRVRVGKFTTRQKAIELESKLSQEGYPTKIYP